MDLDKRIEKLERALQNCKPSKCKDCKFVTLEDPRDEYTNAYCRLIDGDSYECMINYELANDDINFRCPLIDKDSEEYKTIKEELEILTELKEARIYLKTIEDIARDAFSDPETLDINYYRAQALANIYAIFEYNGTTIKREEG